MNEYPPKGTSFELTPNDQYYPQHLKELDWCPDKIYGWGDPALLTQGVGIIGARKATSYGREVSELIAGWSCQLGFPVYSGCAIGCDQAAHRGALNAGGVTIAVLGCGADVVYPASSTALLERIGVTGCVVSLFEWKTKPKKFTFIMRNKLIAAMSHLLIVAEGRMPSGTFSAVKWAQELGVEIGAVPGSIFSPESTAANHLIGAGAMPITSKDDLVIALERITSSTFTGLFAPEPLVERNLKLSCEQRKVIDIIKGHPMDVQSLATTAEMNPLDILVMVGELEILGAVSRGADGLVRVRASI